MIVHLLMDEKFTDGFINLVDKELNKNRNHVFLMVTKHDKLRYEICSDAEIVFIRKNVKSLLNLVYYLIKTDKIIIHGLFNPILIFILYCLNVGKKSVWAIWGGDLYDYKKEKGIKKFIKKRFIHSLYGVAATIDGDVLIARNVYGFNGKYFPCLLYTSNIINTSLSDECSKNDKTDVTVLIGNSADSENRHEYILNKIKRLDLKNARFIIPLSYGNKENADYVEKIYKDQFGDRVTCLRVFLPKTEYLKLLSEVDVVLFAHLRQQGVGNIIQLVDSGAKIYLESSVTTYSWLKGFGIKVFDFENIGNEMNNSLTHEEKMYNREIIRSIANKENLIKQLNTIFLD